MHYITYIFPTSQQSHFTLLSSVKVNTEIPQTQKYRTHENSKCTPRIEVQCILLELSTTRSKRSNCSSPDYQTLFLD